MQQPQAVPMPTTQNNFFNGQCKAMNMPENNNNLKPLKGKPEIRDASFHFVKGEPIKPQVHLQMSKHPPPQRQRRTSKFVPMQAEVEPDSLESTKIKAASRQEESEDIAMEDSSSDATKEDSSAEKDCAKKTKECLTDQIMKDDQLEIKRKTFVEQFSKGTLKTKGFYKQKNLVQQLLRTEDNRYLVQYWSEYFLNIKSQEIKSMPDTVLNSHPEISKGLRAHFIDWIFHVCSGLEKIDKTLPFICINILDRYLNETSKAQNALDLQLIGASALFMTSKFHEVECSYIDQIVGVCYGKFTAEQILQKETEIIKTLQCELDVPHLLEFVILYFNLVRLYVEQSSPVPASISKYIDQAQQHAIDYCRVVLADVGLTGVRPSVIAAAATIFGFFCAFQRNKKAEQSFITDEEIRVATLACQEIIQVLIPEAKFSELEEFMQEIANRAIVIYTKQGSHLKTLFTKSIVDMLPRYNPAKHISGLI